ncbi:coiled-coil domain-containing protein 97 isoform X1 [Melopsittacus undulatus]|uniref:coiled-coil domain-containing protein 97 isoform X1 n=1 Tax=Melopsittacus undulatus TaxID=13146 RepID=UPI00146DB764|nr:coiled-coil domain-containing protein 97 isoform X1 [Melopsittacus undulatus]
MRAVPHSNGSGLPGGVLEGMAEGDPKADPIEPGGTPMGDGRGLPRPRRPQARTVVRNRRFAALQELRRGGQYFSEQEMRAREPLLYQHYIGQYQEGGGDGPPPGPPLWGRPPLPLGPTAALHGGGGPTAAAEPTAPAGWGGSLWIRIPPLCPHLPQMRTGTPPPPTSRTHPNGNCSELSSCPAWSRASWRGRTGSSTTARWTGMLTWISGSLLSGMLRSVTSMQRSPALPPPCNKGGTPPKSPPLLWDWGEKGGLG